MDILKSLIKHQLPNFETFYEHVNDDYSVIAIPTGTEDSTPDLAEDRYIEIFGTVKTMKNFMNIQVLMSTPASFSDSIFKDDQSRDVFAKSIEASDSTWNHDFFLFIVIET